MTGKNCHPQTGPQEALDRASAVAHQGDDLIKNSHYAEDSIQPKCSEIRAISENVSSKLRAKKDHLLKALELHHCLEKVRRQLALIYSQYYCIVCMFVHVNLDPKRNWLNLEVPILWKIMISPIKNANRGTTHHVPWPCTAGYSLYHVNICLEGGGVCWAGNNEG